MPKTCLPAGRWPDSGSHESHFELHSSAMGRKNGEVRFRRWSFAGQRVNSQQALKPSGVRRTFVFRFGGRHRRLPDYRERDNAGIPSAVHTPSA